MPCNLCGAPTGKGKALCRHHELSEYHGDLFERDAEEAREEAEDE